MDTYTGENPGYQRMAYSLETHLVIKWGDIGHLHVRALSTWRSGWMNGNEEIRELKRKAQDIDKWKQTMTSAQDTKGWWTYGTMDLWSCISRIRFWNKRIVWKMQYFLISLMMILLLCVFAPFIYTLLAYTLLAAVLEHLYRLSTGKFLTDSMNCVMHSESCYEEALFNINEWLWSYWTWV